MIMTMTPPKKMLTTRPSNHEIFCLGVAKVNQGQQTNAFCTLLKDKLAY